MSTIPTGTRLVAALQLYTRTPVAMQTNERGINNIIDSNRHRRQTYYYQSILYAKASNTYKEKIF